jgi:hypothetical protein
MIHHPTTTPSARTHAEYRARHMAQRDAISAVEELSSLAIEVPIRPCAWRERVSSTLRWARTCSRIFPTTPITSMQRWGRGDEPRFGTRRQVGLGKFARNAKDRIGCLPTSMPRSLDTSVSHFCPTARQNNPKIPHLGDRSVHSYTSHNKRLRQLQPVAAFEPARSFNPWVQGSSP